MKIYTIDKYSYFLNEFFEISYTSLNIMTAATDTNLLLQS